MRSAEGMTKTSPLYWLCLATILLPSTLIACGPPPVVASTDAGPAQDAGMSTEDAGATTDAGAPAACGVSMAEREAVDVLLRTVSSLFSGADHALVEERAWTISYGYLTLIASETSARSSASGVRT